MQCSATCAIIRGMLKYCGIFAQITDGTIMEQLGKHVPMATDTYATIQELLEMVFPTQSVQRDYNEGK